MLAIAMNGEPLPVEHGFPVRMVVPGLYGYVSATKWLVDLEVTKFSNFTAYWTERGWSAAGTGQDRVADRRTRATARRSRRAGARFGGSAWAQHTGIEKVEVQLDGGPWQETELGRVPNDDTWVQWAASATSSPASTRSWCGPPTERRHPDPGAGRRDPRRRDRLAHRGVRGA